MDSNQTVMSDYQEFRSAGISADPAAILTLAVAIKDSAVNHSQIELLGHEVAMALKNVFECSVVRVEASVSND